MVTDGHVRARRLRRLQPWIIALGIILLWAGFMITRLGPDLAPGMPAAAKLQERLMELSQRVSVAFRKIPPVALPVEAQKSLPPVKEVIELVGVVTKALNDSDDLPEDDIKFTEVEEEEAFWKGDWGTEQVHYLRDGDNVLVAGNISIGSPTYPQPARWIGLFHKGETEKGDNLWVYASLASGLLFAPQGLPAVSPEQVPLSLEAFLPEPPPPPATQQQPQE